MTRVAPALSSTLAGIEAAAVRIIGSESLVYVLPPPAGQLALPLWYSLDLNYLAHGALALAFEAPTRSDTSCSCCPFHAVCDARMDAPPRISLGRFCSPADEKRKPSVTYLDLLLLVGLSPATRAWSVGTVNAYGCNEGAVRVGRRLLWSPSALT